MGTGQMMLVLFAMILFSSIMIGTMNNMFDLSTISYEAMIQMQGQRIIDRYYQEIDSAILSGKLKFSEINSYDNLTEEFKINGIIYHVNINTNYTCRRGHINHYDPDYQRVDLFVWCKGVRQNTIRIGTKDNPISRMYAKMGF